MSMSFHSNQELADLGLGACGDDVQISTKASIHNAKNIRIGNHVRIDDFCVLSAGEGGIEIGNFIHVAVFSSLIGAGRITLQDFCGLASHTSVYSSNDDYSGVHMTNPTVPQEFTGVTHAPVTIGRHAIVGAGSVVLPDVILEEGVAVGALSLVNRSCQAFGVYAGRPARRIGNRKRDLLELESLFLRQTAARRQEIVRGTRATPKTAP
jgi:acetyltransferase-like isoleucine patch superfamily enzyme